MRTAWWQWDWTTMALVFAVFGLIAAAGAVSFPDVRPTLFVLYWTFLFVAALLRFLTPERRISATVGEHVYADLAANETALVESYNLTDTRVYAPRGSTEGPPVRLFVPRHSEYDLPTDELDSLLIVSDVKERRGVSLLPSGGRLFREFESMLDTDLSDSPNELAAQLADGATEGLELADRIVSDVRLAERCIDFEVTGSVHGPVDRFDHPMQSFLSVGLAVGLDRPVVTGTTTNTGRSDYTITCRWLREEDSDDEAPPRRSSEGSLMGRRARTNESVPETRADAAGETEGTTGN